MSHMCMWKCGCACYLVQASDAEMFGMEWQGLVAKDKFYLTYHGDALSPSMEEVRGSRVDSRRAS